jgi:class 3 adenylate cyclase
MDLGPVYVSQNAVTGIADLGGAALNFAARLEKSAEPGEVLVSERVKHFSRSIIDRYRFTQRDVILTKAVATYKAGAQVSCFKVEEIRES